jgi:pimeloyl-ACP methyl ester carboxylesterase
LTARFRASNIKRERKLVFRRGASFFAKGYSIMAMTKELSNKQASDSIIRHAMMLGTFLIIFTGFSFTLFAADSPQKTTASKANSADELPKPEDITLTTDDGLRLAITYYPGTKGKQSIPVILLHEWKHNRTDYTKGLAPYLQANGFAVVAPDLRGHGESTRMTNQRGKDEILNPSSFTTAQFSLMVTQDLKAVKEFLWARNNAGELNLDKLCVIGSEMGASIALNFALYDAEGYDQDTVTYGPLKLGRFIKALVLISPEISFKGISLRGPMQNPVVRGDISLLILVGNEDERALGEAKRVYTIFEHDHPKPDPNKKAEQQTLFFYPLETKLQGTTLLAEKNLKVGEMIVAFLNLRLLKSDESKTWLWKERKLPHQ